MSSSSSLCFCSVFPPLTVCSCLLNSTSFLLLTLLLLSFLPDSYSCPSCSTFLPSSFDTAITPVLPAITLLPLFFLYDFLSFSLLHFLPSSFLSLPAHSHMQLCKWQDAVWLWCGLAVVCLHCHCGSFCLPACCFTLSGPGRLPACLPGWLAGWSSDWLTAA